MDVVDAGFQSNALLYSQLQEVLEIDRRQARLST